MSQNVDSCLRSGIAIEGTDYAPRGLQYPQIHEARHFSDISTMSEAKQWFKTSSFSTGNRMYRRAAMAGPAGNIVGV